MRASLLLAGALAAAAGPASPPEHGRARQRYRVEIAGEAVGWASLRVICRRTGCTSRWESALRLPAEAGGGVVEKRVDAETDGEGRARAVKVVLRGDGPERRLSRGSGPAPASIAELLLSTAAEGERRCLAVREEETGRAGEACATRRGEWLEGSVLGEPVRFRAVPGGLPQEVLLPAQGARFASDLLAALPAHPPRLFGAAVPADPGAAAGAARFCGLPPEPSPPAAAGIPARFPEGESCREKTARYLAAAAGAGLRGRHVVGVAWDGREFAWHEWAELEVGGLWVAVDPSFRQAPAAGPRFAVARYRTGDEAGRGEAGRRILACWGRARVEAR